MSIWLLVGIYALLEFGVKILPKLWLFYITL